MNLEIRVIAFQAQLRAYAFTPELETAATDLQRLLAVHRAQRVDATDLIRLKALALLAEYLDAFGRAAEAAVLLKPTAQELLRSLHTWPAELAASSEPHTTRRLLRQRVWCCAAYAVCLLRANRLAAAGQQLQQLRTFVDTQLARYSHEYLLHLCILPNRK